jgi:hypothetical protein
MTPNEIAIGQYLYYTDKLGRDWLYRVTDISTYGTGQVQSVTLVRIESPVRHVPKTTVQIRAADLHVFHIAPKLMLMIRGIT